MALIVNPATGAPYAAPPQPVWISEEGAEDVRTLVMVTGDDPRTWEVICILGVVRVKENGAGEYMLPHTKEQGEEADADAAMQKVMEIITHHVEGQA